MIFQHLKSSLADLAQCNAIGEILDSVCGFETCFRGIQRFAFAASSVHVMILLRSDGSVIALDSDNNQIPLQLIDKDTKAPLSAAGEVLLDGHSYSIDKQTGKVIGPQEKPAMQLQLPDVHTPVALYSDDAERKLYFDLEDATYMAW